MAELNEQMLRPIVDIIDEVGMLKDEPVQATPKEEPKTESQEPELKDLIRQMLVDMQASYVIGMHESCCESSTEIDVREVA